MEQLENASMVMVAGEKFKMNMEVASEEFCRGEGAVKYVIIYFTKLTSWWGLVSEISGY